MEYSSGLFISKDHTTDEKPCMWRVCIRPSRANQQESVWMNTEQRQFCLSDLNTDVNQPRESLGHSSKTRQCLLFCVGVETVIDVFFLPWEEDGSCWRWELVLDGDTEIPMSVLTKHQGRVKHGFISKEALQKLSATKNWSRNPQCMCYPHVCMFCPDMHQIIWITVPRIWCV